MELSKYIERHIGKEQAEHYDQKHIEATVALLKLDRARNELEEIYITEGIEKEKAAQLAFSVELPEDADHIFTTEALQKALALLNTAEEMMQDCDKATDAYTETMNLEITALAEYYRTALQDFEADIEEELADEEHDKEIFLAICNDYAERYGRKVFKKSYSGATNFLSSELFYFVAIITRLEGKDREHCELIFDAAIDKKITSWGYTKPRSEGRTTTKSPEAKRGQLPIGTVNDQIYNMLDSADGRLDLVADTINTRQRRQAATAFMEEENGQQVFTLLYKTEHRAISVSMYNADQLSLNGKYEQPYSYLMQQMNLAGYFKAASSPSGTIQIPIKDFVELGMYSNTANAKRGLKPFTDALLSLRTTVENKSKNGSIKGFDSIVLFTRARIEPYSKYIEITPNPEMPDWLIVANKFIEMPDTYFAEPTKAAILHRHIKEKARIELTKPDHIGSFTMSFKDIRGIIGLDHQNPKDKKGKIIKPILENIDIVSKAEPELNIEIKNYNPKDKADTIIDTAYIIVSPSGSEAYTLYDIADKKAQKIEKNKQTAEKQAQKSQRKKKTAKHK